MIDAFPPAIYNYYATNTLVVQYNNSNQVIFENRGCEFLPDFVLTAVLLVRSCFI